MARVSQTDRLDRIEEKIDKMSEAIIALARAEEKITTLAEFSKQQSIMIGTLTARIEEVEKHVSKNASTVNVINRIFWIIIAAAATAVTGMLIIGG